MSWYLTIRSDPSYSRSIATETLVDFLRTLPGLVQAGPQEFRNGPDLPWTSLCFADAGEAGNYAITDDPPSTVNVVELICEWGDEDWYESLARRVAAFLQWEAVEEHSGRVIYPSD